MPLTLLPTTDADIVRAAIRLAGRNALLFDTKMIEAQITELGGLKSPSIGTLRRHLAAWEKDALLVRMASRLPLVFDLSAAKRRARSESRPAAAPSRGRFLLTEREHELQDANPAHLDDQTRTAVALQLAQFVLGGEPAPTRLVTHVLQTVPALRIQTIQDTNVLLQQLVDAPYELVAREVVRGRSVRWSVTGAIRGAWLRWVVDSFKTYGVALESAQRVAAAGAASHNELARDLVSACAIRHVSPTWPAGRPVTMREIATVLATVRRDANTHDVLWGLDHALTGRKGGVNGAIHDATRTRYSDGSKRRRLLVEKVAHPAVTGVAYATAALPSSVAPAWLLWQRLKEETGRIALIQLADEWRASAPDAPSDDPPLAALQACQRVALARRLDTLRDDLHALIKLAGTVSQTLVDAVEKRRTTVLELRKGWETTAALQRAARKELRPLGFTLDDVLDASRPQITADAYASLLPSSLSAGTAPSVLVANLSGVRRDRSVDAESTTTRVGAGRVARLHLDRVDAVMAAAETARLPGMQPLTAAGRVLGRWIAHVPLVRRLAASTVLETRLVGLAGLVLLEDVAHAEVLVERRLRDPRALDQLREAAALIELSWWFSQPAREVVLARAKGHPAQVIARVTKDVRMAAAGRS